MMKARVIEIDEAVAARSADFRKGYMAFHQMKRRDENDAATVQGRVQWDSGWQYAQQKNFPLNEAKVNNTPYVLALHLVEESRLAAIADKIWVAIEQSPVYQKYNVHSTQQLGNCHFSRFGAFDVDSGIVILVATRPGITRQQFVEIGVPLVWFESNMEEHMQESVDQYLESYLSLSAEKKKESETREKLLVMAALIEEFPTYAQKALDNLGK